MQLEEYLKNHDNFRKSMVYNFIQGWGGIGDYIKFFLYALSLCMKHEMKIKLKINNTPIEQYIKLKHNFMYITEEELNSGRILNVTSQNFKNARQFNIVRPQLFYMSFTEESINNINANDIFYFSEEITNNVKNIIQLKEKENYISFHIRLGDKFLETDKSFVYINNLEDTRIFSEEKLFNFLEKNKNNKVLLFCDNKKYKKNLCVKYDFITITEADVAHSDFKNTSEKQLIDTITEFYILCNSSLIYAVSHSGFSFTASLFNNNNCVKLY